MCVVGYVVADDVVADRKIKCCCRWSSAGEDEDQRWRLSAVEDDVPVLNMLKMF